jgi:hypothetical protein
VKEKMEQKRRNRNRRGKNRKQNRRRWLLPDSMSETVIILFTYSFLILKPVSHALIGLSLPGSCSEIFVDGMIHQV